MPAHSTGQERRRRQARRRIGYLVGTLAVIAVGVVVTAVVLRQPPNQPARHDAAATVSPAPASASARPTPAFSAPAGPLLLPRPARTTNGVGVGYPYTTAGAIAAAAHYTEEAVTLDEARGAKVAATVAAPSYRTASTDERASVRALRSSLGLSEGGRTDGAYATLQAQAYQLRTTSAEGATVWILGLASAAGPSTSGANRTVPQATVVPLTWVGGDWRLRQTNARVPDAAVVQPGTTEAYAKGWHDLAIAD